MKNLLFAMVVVCSAVGCEQSSEPNDVNQSTPNALHDRDETNDAWHALGAIESVAQGRRTFRYDTFGDEAFWGDQLRLHEAVATIGPDTALAVGLKVDSQALPDSLVRDIRAGRVDLTSPATTLALLKLNAVVGVTGIFDRSGQMTSMGVQCALCHSTVDDSFAPGVGRRLDGWPNRDLNVGAIVALAPNLSPFTSALGVDDATVRTVLRSWGPGRYDAALILDGQAFRPDGKSASTLIPPAFGLGGTNLATFTGWGSVPHWNALVAVLEMHGQGNFSDERLNDPKFPVARRAGFAHVTSPVDRVTPKLANLQAYQLSLAAPRAPQGSYNWAAAARGKNVFEGKARCASCHVPPLFTEPGWNMHTPAEIGIDGFQASRSPDNRYRTTPLKGLHARSKGGYYHDGRFATLSDVVNHYERHFQLALTPAQKGDLVEYLKSL